MRRHLEKIVLAVVLLATSGAMGLNYVWLTDYETSTRFPGDIHWFSGRDTLWGPVHSNDWIGTMDAGGGVPVFYGVVSSSRQSFRPGSPNPAGQFWGGQPVFNAPRVEIDDEATWIRQMAQAENSFVDLEATWEEGRAVIDGSVLNLYHWPEGTPFDPTTAFMQIYTLAGPNHIFVDGKLEVHGILDPQGIELVLACSRNMIIMDDVIYEGTNLTNGTLPPNCTSRLALVSEQSMVIGNTWENGRENCSGPTPDHCHVVVTALMFALNGSFEMEQQNDVYEPYISPIAPDERGSIILRGGITQRFWGYTHRSNQGSTGYTPILYFDERLAEWDIGLLRNEDFITPDTLMFENVPVTHTVRDTVHINAVGWSLSVLSAPWPFSTPPLYQALPPYNIVVSFTPPSVGQYSGTMTFYFNGETFLYPLRGNAIPPPGPMVMEPALFPNPFNSEAKLKFELAEAGEVRAVVYDVLGRETVRLADGIFQAGEHTIAVNANAWASGVYFLRLETAEKVKTMKMVMVR